MKIGVLTEVWDSLPLEQALDTAKEYGVEAVELGAGNYASTTHFDPSRALREPDYAQSVNEAIRSRQLELSAVAVHGNPLHPDPSIAKKHDEGFRLACRAARLLNVDTVIVFSGCPGDRAGGSTPNWVTCTWPAEYRDLYEWQWSEVVIPYWQKAARFAEDNGVRLAFEMHPGMVVYNNETLMRLREAIGAVVGVNLDPSHLFWQGIDVVAATRELGRHSAIFHVHAKDTSVDAQNVARNGNIDPKPFTQIIDRAWTFRAVGYGHGEEFWRAFVTELRIAGFNGVLSIEHEDPLCSINEGLRRGVEMLRRCMLTEPAAIPWWM